MSARSPTAATRIRLTATPERRWPGLPHPTMFPRRRSRRERRIMSRPTIDEVRAEGQPRWVVERVNDEHLFGRLYMRKLSPRATWAFARLGLSPNAVTLGFILCGVAAGVVVAFGGLATAIIATVLVQAGLLCDCADGELARLTKRTSVGGIYLDRIGHYLCDAAFIIGLGFRAQGHLTTSGRYITAGLAAAVLAILVKAEDRKSTR